MELRVLKYYLMVAREENITKAAELLHITQPTLSRQLRQLEEELGVCLFQRGKHSIILTGREDQAGSDLPGGSADQDYFHRERRDQKHELAGGPDGGIPPAPPGREF